MNNPNLSIIIPVYNAASFLQETIASITRQQYNDYEIVIIDDGSIDNSLALCKNLQQNNPQIRIFHQENKGVSSARNLGIKKSKGNYLYFMDADDLLHPQFLEIMMKQIQQNSLIDLVCCTFQAFGHIADFHNYTNYSVQAIESKDQDIFNHLMYHSCAVNLWTKIMKKAIFDKYKILFQEGMTYGEDMFVSWKFCLAAQKAIVIDLPLYYYRQTSNSAVSRYHPKLYQTYKASFEEIKRFVHDNHFAPLDFEKNYNIYFAERLPALLRMEVRAPYTFSQKIKNLKTILDDQDIQKGLLHYECKSRIYSYARKKQTLLLFLYGLINDYKQHIKNSLRHILHK